MEIKLGERVVFNRNGFDGYGIVIAINDEDVQIAICAPLSEPQTYAYFTKSELVVKMF